MDIIQFNANKCKGDSSLFRFKNESVLDDALGKMKSKANDIANSSAVHGVKSKVDDVTSSINKTFSKDD